MRRRFLTLILVGSAIALLSGLTPAFAGTAAGSAVCNAAAGVTGPAYSGPSTGNTYNLTVGGSGVTCAFATRWLRKLAPRKTGKLPTALAGPAGWTCTAIHMGPGWPLKAYQGLCRKGTLKIVWSPRVGGVGG